MEDMTKGQEQNYFKMRIVRIYMLSAALVSTVLFALALEMDFDPETRIFKAGSVLAPIAFYLSVALAAIALALPFVLIPKREAEKSPLPESDRYFEYYTLDPLVIKVIRPCVAVMLIMQCTVRMLVVVLKSEPTGLSAPLAMIMLAFTVPLALYFVPELTARLDPTRFKAHIVLGCVGILWFFLNVLDRYFDKSVSLASSFDTVLGLCLVLGMLALVYEMKYRLDGISVRARIATSGAFFILAFGIGIGQLVMLVSKGSTGFYMISLGVSLLVLSVYYGARIAFYTED